MTPPYQPSSSSSGDEPNNDDDDSSHQQQQQHPQLQNTGMKMSVTTTPSSIFRSTSSGYNNPWWDTDPNFYPSPVATDVVDPNESAEKKASFGSLFDRAGLGSDDSDGDGEDDDDDTRSMNSRKPSGGSADDVSSSSSMGEKRTGGAGTDRTSPKGGEAPHSRNNDGGPPPAGFRAIEAHQQQDQQQGNNNIHNHEVDADPIADKAMDEDGSETESEKMRRIPYGSRQIDGSDEEDRTHPDSRTPPSNPYSSSSVKRQSGVQHTESIRHDHNIHSPQHQQEEEKEDAARITAAIRQQPQIIVSPPPAPSEKTSPNVKYVRLVKKRLEKSPPKIISPASATKRSQAVAAKASPMEESSKKSRKQNRGGFMSKISGSMGLLQRMEEQRKARLARNQQNQDNNSDSLIGSSSWDGPTLIDPPSLTDVPDFPPSLHSEAIRPEKSDVGIQPKTDGAKTSSGAQFATSNDHMSPQRQENEIVHATSSSTTQVMSFNVDAKMDDTDSKRMNEPTNSFDPNQAKMMADMLAHDSSIFYEDDWKPPAITGMNPQHQGDEKVHATGRSTTTQVKSLNVDAKADDTDSKQINEPSISFNPNKETTTADILTHGVSTLFEDDWKPPALTTYGESRYKPPPTSPERDDPEALVLGQGLMRKYTLPSETLNPILETKQVAEETIRVGENETPRGKKKAEKPTTPPLSEITVIHKDDDESSLDTQGVYLERFPNKKDYPSLYGATSVPAPAVTSDQAIIDHGKIHSAEPIGAEYLKSDYDYYKSVINPGTTIHREATDDPRERKDPPTDSDLFPSNPQNAAYQHDAGNLKSIPIKRNVEQQNVELPRIGDDKIHSVEPSGAEYLKSDYDYYKSWTNPGTTVPREATDDRNGQKDPPTDTELFPFNPQSVLYQHDPENLISIPVKRNIEQQNVELPQEDLNTGIDRNGDALNNSSSWVPGKTKPTGDSHPVVPLVSKKSSNDSVGSIWAPPGFTRSRPREEVNVDPQRAFVNGIMARKRSQSPDYPNPRVKQAKNQSKGTSARVDFAGSINSSSTTQPTSEPSKSSKSHSSGSKPPMNPRLPPPTGPRNKPSPSSQQAKTSTAESATDSSRLSSTPEHRLATDAIFQNNISDAAVASNVPPLSRPRKMDPSGSDFIPGESAQSVKVKSTPEMQVVSLNPALGEGYPIDSRANKNPSSVSKNEQFVTLSESESEEMKSSSSLRRRTRNHFLIMFIILLVLAGVAVGAVFLFQNDSNSAETIPPNTTSPESSVTDLRDLILSVSPESEAALEDQSSAQSLALDWLFGNPSLESYSPEQRLQRYVLATTYYSAGGADWFQNDLWLSDASECDWYQSETETEVCTAEGALDEIDLDNNNLSGSLPWTELAILQSQLLVLDVFANRLTGTISPMVERLTSLIALDLQQNDFSGTLPTQLQDLTTLQHLLLSDNGLSGTIPIQISRMSSLKSIRLSRNSFRGTVPTQLGLLTNLRTIYLDGNDFSGSVPDELCSLGLDDLVVDCDQLTCDCCSSGSATASPSIAPASGPSPESSPTSNSPPTGQAPTNEGNLRDVIISAYPPGEAALNDNTSPQSLALEWLESSANSNVITNEGYLQRYALATFYFSTNGDEWTDNTGWMTNSNECSWFSTADPGNVCDSSGRYLEINLQQNNLVGTVPPEVTILSSTLQSLNLKDNGLSSELPTFVVDLPSLKTLDLSTNQFFGRLPPALFNATSLTRLSLLENSLFSTIPSELGQLTKLELLDLGSNQLTGSVPSSVGELRNLAGLSVFNNQLSGTIPLEIGTLQGLELLYVDSNNFQAPVSNGICALSNIQEFWSDCEEVQCVCCTSCCTEESGCVET